MHVHEARNEGHQTASFSIFLLNICRHLENNIRQLKVIIYYNEINLLIHFRKNIRSKYIPMIKEIEILGKIFHMKSNFQVILLVEI